MKLFLRALFLVLILFTAGNLFAGSTGKISGTVKDKATGEPMPYANVYIKGTSLGAATDLNGYFTILNVPPGVYTVTASVVGYQRQEFKGVTVNIDFTTRLNFELSQGSILMKAIVVRGVRHPLIRQDLTNSQVSITSESIQQLPVDQISDIIKLQAGVVVGNNGVIHIRGGYGNEIAYTLNGISLNDPYNNTRSVGLAINAVKEVSLSAGTFAAEYGNALSGVVNYVTKEGGSKYSFSLRGYSGDYLSTHKNLFFNIDKIDPLNHSRLEGTLGGPVPFTNKKLKFFMSSVFENFKGSLYGIRLYNPTDSYLAPESFKKGDKRKGLATDPYYFNPYSPNSNGLPTGNGKIVAMNPSLNMNFQGNISYQLTSLIKLRYEAVYDYGRSQSFNRAYEFNPDGRGTNYGSGLIQTLDFTHTVNQNMFYTLKASYGYHEGKYYLYKNYNDPRYLPLLYRRTLGNTIYLTGGTDNARFRRKTTTTTIKGDLTAEVFDHHEIKMGFEGRFHKVFMESYSVQLRTSKGAKIITDDLLYGNNKIIRYKPPKTQPSLITAYTMYPVDAAFYIQDKMELAKTLILNIGLRYEYFNPKALYNPNLSKDLQDIKFGYINRSAVPAKVKHELSPRISFSFPITARSVIRFSYGHFYQNGSLSSLYRNPYFYVTNFGSNPTFGNPNVNLQKSVQYEMGLQQQLSENFKFDLTGYYKDVRDYIFTQTVFTPTGREFRVLTNLAYSNVKGISLSFYKRRAPGSLWDARLDYTFQIANGNRTYPANELFYSEISNEQTEMYLVPLSFDRSHVINASLGYTKPNNWSLGIIANFQMGTPYTPILPSTIPRTITYEQNSGRQPIQWNVDLKLEKYFKVGPFNYSLFVRIYNLFDTENEEYVYASSGRALSSVEQTSNKSQFTDIVRRIKRGDSGLFGLSTINGYYSNRPERISRPREVRVGFSIIFN